MGIFTMMTRAAKTQLQPGPKLNHLAPRKMLPHNPRIDLALDSTERPLPSAELRAATFTVDGETLARYPDARSLEAVLALRQKTSPEHVVVTAGADEALDRACRVMLTAGDELLVATPTFEAVYRYAHLAGSVVRAVHWGETGFPVAGILEAANDKTRVLVVVSPNNPTGAVIKAAELAHLATQLPGVLIVLYMAYGEFADHDLSKTALKFNNVLMIRSLSKAWGLPGVRIGYAVGAPEVLRWLRTVGSPYLVARSSIALAHTLLSVGELDMRTCVERVRSERRELVHLLRHLGAKVWPSQANFVLAFFKNAEWVTQALVGQGIGIARFSHDPSLAQARRITCPGDGPAFARLESALKAAMAPQALLLDLHGTLFHPETLAPLCHAHWLEQIAARLPLAAVTSWPRAQAERLLHEHAMAGYFKTLVCAEDAPDKPNPAGVELALTRLHVQTAWMVGDTSQDIRAARDACRLGFGVVPLGTVSAQERTGHTDAAAYQAQILLKAGAARVLSDLTELGDML